MKNFFTIAAFTLSAFSVNAQIRMPAPSPTQMISQDFGMGKVEVTYSRPALKGREVYQEKSDLAPLNQIWRTGANAATRIKFTDAVTIGGKNLDTGSYVLYTIPGSTEWTIILNKGLNNWGIDGYKESEDVVRFKVPAHQVNTPSIENFTMQFHDIKPESMNLDLIWNKTLVMIPISTNIKDRLKSQIEQALTGEKKPYWQAANFYYEWDNNNAKALENVNMAIKENPDGFWMYLLKAKIEKANGNTEAAKQAALKTKEIAAKQGNQDYVKQAEMFIASL